MSTMICSVSGRNLSIGSLNISSLVLDETVMCEICENIIIMREISNKKYSIKYIFIIKFYSGDNKYNTILYLFYFL